MKRFLSVLLWGVLYFSGTMAQVAPQKPKLSPQTRLYLQHATSVTANNPLQGYVYKYCGGTLCVSAFIKVNSNIDTAKLALLGIYTGTRAGNIWTVQVPVSVVKVFTTLPGIDYIQLDEPVYPMLDSVRKVTHTDSVQAGIGLPIGYSGKNVVTGIIDAGFDYGHPEFYDTSGKRYRVKRVWEEKTTGTPPAGFAYGNEMTDSATIIAKGTDNNTLSHGTHVAGIAAGSGYGGDSTNARYRGMAYDADVVLVGIFPSPDQWMNTGMTDFVDGINYIFKYAQSVGKPAVVNLSWGASLGPHDGTALFSQACDNLTGKGKIFVCAAGNNGGENIHLQKQFTPSDTVVNTFVTFDPNLGFNDTWIDIWGDTGKSFCTAITLYNGSAIDTSTGFVCLDDTTHSYALTGANKDTCFVTITTSPATFNQKPRTYLTISSKVNDAICLSIKGTSGAINAWNGYVYNHEGYYGPFINYLKAWAVKGDDNQTISDVGSTRSAITAGAFTSKVLFTNISGAPVSYGLYYKLGDIASFSSKGPTADNRVKPDIAAPGMIVGSGINSYDTSYLPGGTNYASEVSVYTDSKTSKKYIYAMLAGTSMASPATAGIVALMLQAKPVLTPTDVKLLLAQTAIQDSYTGAIPAGGSNIWGAGKINAYAAMKKTIEFTTVRIVPAMNNELHLYPNPSNGRFTISYTGVATEALTIQVYDISGHGILWQSWQTSRGDNVRSLDLSGYSAGTYFIKLTTAQGAALVKAVIR